MLKFFWGEGVLMEWLLCDTLSSPIIKEELNWVILITLFECLELGDDTKERS